MYMTVKRQHGICSTVSLSCRLFYPVIAAGKLCLKDYEASDGIEWLKSLPITGWSMTLSFLWIARTLHEYRCRASTMWSRSELWEFQDRFTEGTSKHSSSCPRYCSLSSSFCPLVGCIKSPQPIRLATLVGGFLPLMLRVMAPRRPEKELKTVSFRSKMDEVIKKFYQYWPIYDLPFEVVEEVENPNAEAKTDLNDNENEVAKLRHRRMEWHCGFELRLRWSWHSHLPPCSMAIKPMMTPYLFVSGHLCYQLQLLTFDEFWSDWKKIATDLSLMFCEFEL